MAALQKSYLEQAVTQDELACIYSALILADDDIPVTEEKIKTILKAAQVEVEPLWPALFSRALAGCDIRSMITNVGGAAMAGGQPAGGGGAAGEETKEEEKKVEVAPPEPEDDSDDDFGLSLFD